MIIILKGQRIFEYCYLYTAYADDTIFFLKDENSIVHPSEKFKLLFDFSGLKPNTTKCEISGGVLKGVQAVACGMKCNDLRNEAIKILGVYFSNNRKINDEKNFYNIISNIEVVLNLWRMRNLTLAISLATSKIVCLALLIKIPYQLAKELEIIQKFVLWKNSTPKIKHKTKTEA